MHESPHGRWVVRECVGVLDCQGCVKCVPCVDVLAVCVYKIIKPYAVGDVQVWAVVSGGRV